jgi:hypothetical protein
MRFIDRQGKEVPNGTKCIAVRDNGDGTSTCYSGSDMEALIKDMKSSRVTGPQITAEYWKPTLLMDCAYAVPDGCDAGQCSIGSCTLVVNGDYRHCMCL